MQPRRQKRRLKIFGEKPDHLAYRQGREVLKDAQAGIDDGGFETSHSAPVSLMITLAQKERFREMGYSDEQIVNMTPEQAHKLPGIFG